MLLCGRQFFLGDWGSFPTRVIVGLSLSDLPGFDDTVEWNLGDPRGLRGACQELLSWFGFF